MFSRIVSTSVRRGIAIGSSSSKAVTLRGFSVKLDIPTDAEQQHGRRKEELDAEAAGDVGFYNTSLVPHADAGTKENPILIPSGEHSRAVGYECPSTHQLVWFNVTKGPLHYINDIGLYFQMKPI